MSQTELLPVASDDAQKTQKNTEQALKVLEMECGSRFFPLFFPLFFFFLLFFFFFFIFFFAKRPKAGQTHRKQATGTVTKHSSAVQILKLTTVRKFPITVQSFL